MCGLLYLVLTVKKIILIDFKCDDVGENFSAKLDAQTQFFAIVRGTNQIKLNAYQCNKLPLDIMGKKLQPCD